MDDGSSTNFVRRYWVRKIKNLDMSARSPDHEHLVLRVHGVTSILELYSGKRGGRSEIPVLDLGDVFPASVTMCWEKRRKTKQKEKRIELGGKKSDSVP